MPRILRHQPLALGCMLARRDPTTCVLTVIAKAAYRVNHDEAATWLEPETPPQFCGDENRHEDEPSSLKSATDFVPFKPRADLLLHGTCHTPDRRPHDMCEVGFAVGSFEKRLLVFGERNWERSLLSGWRASPPAPFTQQSLTYEHAFGGPEHRHNPCGKGAGKKQLHRPLPEIEFPARLVSSPKDDHPPAGFGPLHQAGRRRPGGTFDAKWLKHQWPGLPLDFDYGYFNAAPKDQQIDGYLRGDETLRFTNLHAERPHVESQLPGHRMRAFFNTDEDGARETFAEVDMVLDTVSIDMDAETMTLVWRGVQQVAFSKPEAVQHLYAACEQLDGPAADHPSHFSRYSELLRPLTEDKPEPAVEAPEADAEAEIEQAQAQLELDLARMEEETQQEVDEHLAEACGVLEKAGAPEGLLAGLRTQRDPEEFMRAMMAHIGYAGDDMNRFAEDLAAHNKSVFADMGVDASIFDTEVKFESAEGVIPPTKPEQPDREEFLEHIATNPDCQGMDLSGLDLSGLQFESLQLQGSRWIGTDLHGTTLTSCSLSGADLSTADLTETKFDQCVLDKTRLAQSRMRGCHLDTCYMEATVLDGAELAGATLTSCDLTGAKLIEADLHGATVTQCIMVGADLSDGRLTEAQLQGCDLSGALLTRVTAQDASFRQCLLVGADLSQAQLHGCDLSESTLEGARAAGINLQGAILDGVRAGEAADFAGACLRNMQGAGSRWTGSNLRGADLRAAVLTRASLEGTDLAKADLRCCQARNAVFSAARADAARFAGADLMFCLFDTASLDGADFAGSNLYGAEFLDASSEGTSFLDANLAMTKLVGRERA